MICLDTTAAIAAVNRREPWVHRRLVQALLCLRHEHAIAFGRGREAAERVARINEDRQFLSRFCKAVENRNLADAMVVAGQCAVIPSESNGGVEATATLAFSVRHLRGIAAAKG
jgi:hypothetical protein